MKLKKRYIALLVLLVLAAAGVGLVREAALGRAAHWAEQPPYELVAAVPAGGYSPIPFPEESGPAGDAGVRCTLLPVRCQGDGSQVEISWQWRSRPENTAPLTSDLVELYYAACDELSHPLELTLDPGKLYCLVDYCRTDGTLSETVAVELHLLEDHGMLRAEIPLCRVSREHGTLWPRSGRILLTVGNDHPGEEIFLTGYTFAYRHSTSPGAHHLVDMDDSAWRGWGWGIETVAEADLWIDRQGQPAE